MKRKRLVVRLLATVLSPLAVAGCDDGGKSSPPPAAGTAGSDTSPRAPATSQAAPSTTAATGPVSSMMQIGDRAVVFPPARLRLESDGQRLVALLYSDDPRDALKDNYTGNSFYLRMELDVADDEQLARAAWRYTAPSSADQDDSPYGIYLGGRKVQLVPYQVMGRFKTAAAEATAGGTDPGGREAFGGDAGLRADAAQDVASADPDASSGAVTAVLISGQFQAIDESTRRGPAQLVPVAAELAVRIESAVEKRKPVED